MGHMHKPLANAFTCISERNTWTLLDRKRQIYSKIKCLFLCILPIELNFSKRSDLFFAKVSFQIL
jgi:hypothetical protein